VSNQSIQQHVSKKSTVKLGKTRYKGLSPYHVLLFPAVVLTLIFAYLPMFGLAMAFQDYKPVNGFLHSNWVGLKHFVVLFNREDSVQIIWNTLIIAVMKLIANLIVPFVFALLLNEVRHSVLKRIIQTTVYLPHFLSWVILGGILTDILSTNGLINQLLTSLFGIKSISFLGDGDWFRVTAVISEVWKEFGFGTIMFLAALAGINPSLYEAAEMDGAGRWKQTLYVTVPATLPIVIVIFTLSLGNVLNAGFDQIFNIYNPLVYDKGDIIDTFVYRVGLLNGSYSFATAVGMFKSVISFVLIVTAYWIAYKKANYRVF
jgi:putative aldouronate transport system permease protein